jgi:DNA-binding transcriptional LysR family regulator
VHLGRDFRQSIVHIGLMSAAHRLAQADLNLLVVLDELLRSRSTTVAARRLGRTQSAISHALARLRDTIDDPLFVRAGPTLRPTAFAESLQAPLREVLVRAEALLTRSSGAFDPSRVERTFVLAGADYAEIVFLPRLLAAIRREAPGIDVVTRFLGDDIDRAVQSRDVDLGFSSRLRAASGVTLKPLLEEHMVVLLRRGHPALDKRMTARSYAALDHVLVTPRGLPGSLVDAALEPRGLSRRVVLRTPHFAAAAFVVSTTDLVVTLPACFARAVADGLDLVMRPVPFPLQGFTLSMGYSTGYEDDPAHRWLRERVEDVARTMATAGRTNVDERT